MKLFIDIYSKGDWPANQLSNFADAPFTISIDLDELKPDGLDAKGPEGPSVLTFPCMECFLQALKVSEPNEQLEFQFMTAQEAKLKGSRIQWQRSGYLYWRGQPFRRNDRRTYRKILSQAYVAQYRQNPKSVQALQATGHRLLWHSVGRWFRHQTCLTVFEFLSILYYLRRLIRKGKL